jgi:uncharacterized protein YcfL
MKKYLSIIAFAALLAACGSPTNDAKENVDTSVVVDTKFPFTKQKGTDWEINKDDANTMIVLNVLKSIESKDYMAIGDHTADSVKSDIDGLKFNGTKAEMMKANKDFFETLKSIKIVPKDWLSVVNNDKSQEWVRVWYSQYWEDVHGKRDSLNVFNDIRLKSGKITQWNEYIQHFPKP